jgi:hypothetical protein
LPSEPLQKVPQLLPLFGIDPGLFIDTGKPLRSAIRSLRFGMTFDTLGRSVGRTIPMVCQPHESPQLLHELHLLLQVRRSALGYGQNSVRFRILGFCSGCRQPAAGFADQQECRQHRDEHASGHKYLHKDPHGETAKDRQNHTSLVPPTRVRSDGISEAACFRLGR